MSKIKNLFRGVKHVLIFGFSFAIGYRGSRMYWDFQDVKKKPVILTLNLDWITETSGQDLVKNIKKLQQGSLETSKRKILLERVLISLRQASKDPRVQGIVVKSGGSLSFPVCQEIGELLKAYTDKPISIGYGDSFSQNDYLVCSSLKNVYLQPSGLLKLIGFSSDTIFIKEFLDNWKIRPRVFQRGPFKVSPNFLTENSMTKEHEENTRSLLLSHFRQLARTISQNRNIPEEDIIKLIDQGPFLPEEAKKEKLVDDLLYQRQIVNKLMNEKAMVMQIPDYVPPVKSTNSIAIIKLNGMMNSKMELQFRENIAEVMSTPNIIGVIIRIDSPGGGFTESDSIYQDIKTLKELMKKPVVASLSSVAASGGYYVACGCDRIIAQPGTITGSIGVFAQGIEFFELLKEHGINVQTISVGKNANFERDLPPEVMNKLLDSFYGQFTKIVSESRKLTLQEVEEIAQGKTFTGEQALKEKLVDELGGLSDAIRYVQLQHLQLQQLRLLQLVQLAKTPETPETLEIPEILQTPQELQQIADLQPEPRFLIFPKEHKFELLRRLLF